MQRFPAVRIASDLLPAVLFTVVGTVVGTIVVGGDPLGRRRGGRGPDRALRQRMPAHLMPWLIAACRAALAGSPFVRG